MGFIETIKERNKIKTMEGVAMDFCEFV